MLWKIKIDAQSVRFPGAHLFCASIFARSDATPAATPTDRPAGGLGLGDHEMRDGFRAFPSTEWQVRLTVQHNAHWLLKRPSGTTNTMHLSRVGRRDGYTARPRRSADHAARRVLIAMAREWTRNSELPQPWTAIRLGGSGRLDSPKWQASPRVQVGTTELESVTSCMSSKRSNQLSYAPWGRGGGAVAARFAVYRCPAGPPAPCGC